jgi:hypothetical protein
VLTFPIDHGRKLNIVAFHTSADDWDDYERTTKVVSRQDALRDFAGYGPDVLGLLKLTQEQLNVVCPVASPSRYFPTNLVPSTWGCGVSSVPFANTEAII